jgi:methionyl-tRNA formyltransferase
VAILEDLPEWGVSAHFADEDIDTGDLVAVKRFPIDREAETRSRST